MKRLNGVTVFTLALPAWFAILAVLVASLGKYETARVLAVPASPQLFFDMRQVTEAFDAANRGEEVLWASYTPPGYFPMRFPYHRSWLAFRHLGLTTESTNALSIAFGAAVLVHFAVLIAITGNHAATGAALAAFAGSPFMLLGFERGNPDLLLYLLLAGASHLFVRRAWLALGTGSALVFAAGMLKFVPFAGMLGVLPGGDVQRRRRVLALGVAATGFFIYVEAQDVLRIATSPYASSNWASFGAAVSAHDLGRASAKILGLPFSDTGLWLARVIGTVAIIALASWWWLRVRHDSRSLSAVSGFAATGYALGTAIFVASFLLIRSYNYKIMFLAPALPALVLWARAGGPAGQVARIALALLLAWMWSGLNSYFYVAMNAVAAWVCIAALAALLAALVAAPLANTRLRTANT